MASKISISSLLSQLVLELMGSVNYTTTCEFMRPILEDRIVPEFRNSAYFYKLDVDNDKFKVVYILCIYIADDKYFLLVQVLLLDFVCLLGSTFYDC